ncbi:hypothetical protein V6Z11_D11G232000 [Gossypium hirsutum]
MRPLGVGKWKPSSKKATDKLECVSNNSNVKFFRIDLQNSSQVQLSNVRLVLEMEILG